MDVAQGKSPRIALCAEYVGSGSSKAYMLLSSPRGGCTSAAAALAHTTEATATGADRGAHQSHGVKLMGFGEVRQGLRAKYLWVKEETHAARWGLLRGYSGKATKWVDFVVADSTRRESGHSLRLVGNGAGVKG